VTPFLALPEEVRRVIFTTNAIEALNRRWRKAIKTKSSLPNQDAARKLGLPRAPERRPEMDENPELDDRLAGVQDLLW
jgi:transposase-like protein